jgi:hypothetical protein
MMKGEKIGLKKEKKKRTPFDFIVNEPPKNINVDK